MLSLLGMSFEGDISPSFDLRCLRSPETAPDAWGIAFYPTRQPYSSVLKESKALRLGDTGPGATWSEFESSIFLLQLRKARWGGLNEANTQPFRRSYARRDWLFVHSGNLERRWQLPIDARFEPVGSTDSEVILCEILGRVAAEGWRSLAEADLGVLQGWFNELGEAGDLTSIITDGRDVVAYAGRGPERLYWSKVHPPAAELCVGDDATICVDLTAHGPLARKGVIFCSVPLDNPGGTFEPLAPGQLVVVREGAVRADLPPVNAKSNSSPGPLLVQRPGRKEPKVFVVTHTTKYTYNEPVRRSSHRFRLEPIQNRIQRVHDFDLSVNVGGISVDYDDVFGNRVRWLEVTKPYTEFVVEARSLVEVLETDPLRGAKTHEATTIPLVWMPWQREILHPYLLPEELPDTQLRELSDYAMAFVRRNDYDLLDALLDMNDSLFREFKYVQGSTSIQTTAFQVYLSRQGVCQDFANLFIAMARLLGVPARYVCGYIHVPPTADNQLQSLASHAWVQVYLPDLGWVGMDPTNGVLSQTEHVRVAVGRNYRDATPTSGTIYEGGGRETLHVDVRVEEVASDTRRLPPRRTPPPATTAPSGGAPGGPNVASPSLPPPPLSAPLPGAPRE